MPPPPESPSPPPHATHPARDRCPCAPPRHSRGAQRQNQGPPSRLRAVRERSSRHPAPLPRADRSGPQQQDRRHQDVLRGVQRLLAAARGLLRDAHLPAVGLEPGPLLQKPEQRVRAGSRTVSRHDAPLHAAAHRPLLLAGLWLAILGTVLSPELCSVARAQTPPPPNIVRPWDGYTA